tara:strand:- start:3525 stop:4376 length:852 start_codon:yes stop_codon:yes gene_type:complete
MRSLIVCICLLNQISFAQKADSTRAFHIALGTEIVLYSATMYTLNDLWYKDYPNSSFHWINDNSNWLQMDKLGHATTAYQVGMLGKDLMEWGGVSEKKALWYGGLYGAFFLTTIETLDGFSKEWGASWGDLIANTSGTFVFIGQELLWKEQKFQMKYSFKPSKYAKYRPDLLGSNFLQQSLKDYNGQVYWLSFNINAFKKTSLPDWLNVAIGYGAGGMYNGNPDEEGMHREFYASLDINLRNIKTERKFLDKTLKILSFIKVPMPAFKLSQNKLTFYPLHYGQ